MERDFSLQPLAVDLFAKSESYMLAKNESALVSFKVDADARVRNMYLICSHPSLFGFKTKQLGSQSQEFKLELKAKIPGKINVKFLVRYEVEGARDSVARYRFRRAELNFEVQNYFDFKPTFHLSKKECGHFVVQMATLLHTNFN